MPASPKTSFSLLPSLRRRTRSIRRELDRNPDLAALAWAVVAITVVKLGVVGSVPW